MTITFSDRERALPGYPLAEVPTLKRRLLEQGVDVIDLGAGDADFPPPAVAVDALREALSDISYSKYGFQQGLPQFRRAAADWMSRRFEVAFDPNANLLPLIGSKEGIAHLPLAVMNPGDVGIVPEPGYQAYLGGTILAGGVPHVVPLTERAGFLVDLSALPAEVVRRAKVVFLNYPNNPTTAVATMEYLERTVAFCRKHGIVLAYDNPYCELTFDGYVAPSIFEVRGADEIAVEFFSLSKSFSMTGWRLGWAAGRTDFIRALNRVKSYVDTGPFLAVQKAGAVVLEQAESLVAPIREELRRRRDAGVAALRAAGFAVEVPKGTMYLWVRLPSGPQSAAFARCALETAGVVVLPGSAFGPAGEGFFRVALTVSPERLEAGVSRLAQTLSAMQGAAVATTA